MTEMISLLLAGTSWTIEVRFSILDRDSIFVISTSVIVVTIGPVLSSTLMKLELFPGAGLPSVKLTTHLLELRLRMHGALPPKCLHTAPVDMMEQRHLFMKCCT